MHRDPLASHLQVADIGHCMLPLEQHKFWVGNLEKEFFNQGDLEKTAGVSISPLMDRSKPGPTNGSNQVWLLISFMESCSSYNAMVNQ